MLIKLPTGSTEATKVDPSLLVILSNTKTGKTSSVLQLPNSLLIDLEDGSDFYKGVKLNLKKEAILKNKGLGTLLLQTAETIKAANIENKSPIYDFITIDSLTVVEEIAKIKATLDYKATLVGKNFTGKDVIRELPKGAGYAYFNAAFSELINSFKGLAGKCLILLAHSKLTTLDKVNSKELTVNDAELSGKNKTNIFSNADSIGFMYRNKTNTNQNIMSFKTTEIDWIYGSRSPHLRGKKFVFSEYKPENNTLQTNWDLIFTSLANKESIEMVEVSDDDLVTKSEVETEYPID
jgi:hypothetical protein